MIIGIGTDIVEVARIELAIVRQGERFIEKIFTQNEIEYCTRYQRSVLHYAGRFAAKEAILKAAGTGLRPPFTWHDIEIINLPEGQPHAHLHGSFKELLEGLMLHLSISHCDSYAVAFATLSKREG